MMHQQPTVGRLSDYILSDHNNDLSRTEISGLAMLVKAAAYKDDDTGLHIVRVAFLALEIARLLGLPEEDYMPLVYAAALHDVGKIAIPDAILQKKGPLSKSERIVMEKHCRFGSGLFTGNQSVIAQACRDVALYHHENFDGRGYPQGVSGEDIPLFARIVSIIDVYDALTMDRCYRTAFSHDEGLAIMVNEMQGKFDPYILECFLIDSEGFNRLRMLLNRFGQTESLYDFYG